MKTTSIKVDEELWKRLKILSVKLNMPMSVLLRYSVEAVVEGGELVIGADVQDDALAELRRLRSVGEIPLVIEDAKTAVELVKEGRGR